MSSISLSLSSWVSSSISLLICSLLYLPPSLSLFLLPCSTDLEGTTAESMICLCIYLRACLPAFLYVCLSVCMYVCMYVYLRAWSCRGGGGVDEEVNEARDDDGEHGYDWIYI
jgi:hypothetical protein